MLLTNLGSNDDLNGVNWSRFFGVMLDKVWCRINELVFSNITWSSSDLVIKSRRMIEALDVSDKAFGRVTGWKNNTQQNVCIRWYPPSLGEVAPNCDGSVMDVGQNAAYGGLLRDGSGNFFVGFYAKLGTVTVVEAELWGILYGLKLTWSRGFRRISVQSDSQVAISLPSNGCSRSHVCYPLVSAIHAVYGVDGAIK